jgi:hypothetical protein
MDLPYFRDVERSGSLRVLSWDISTFSGVATNTLALAKS